jgi:hypothetical protein
VGDGEAISSLISSVGTVETARSLRQFEEERRAERPAEAKMGMEGGERESASLSPREKREKKDGKREVR